MKPSELKKRQAPSSNSSSDSIGDSKNRKQKLQKQQDMGMYTGAKLFPYAMLSPLPHCLERKKTKQHNLTKLNLTSQIFVMVLLRFEFGTAHLKFKGKKSG
jgi:hypothetical protein